MTAVLRTGRLLLRRFTAADEDALVELDADPDVMRYLTGGVPTPREVVRRELLPRILAEYERTPGYGRWAAIELAGGGFLGWFALHPVPGRPGDEVELGYRLRKAAWRRGYATEGSLALIRLAFTELGARLVFAETMAVNAASRRVLAKAGLRLIRTYFPTWDDPIDGAEHGEVEYALSRAEWRRSAGAAHPAP